MTKNSDHTISRAELVRVIDEASEGITESTRNKLLALAEVTDAVAVGGFHHSGVNCPIHQVGRRGNQTFQEEFDRAMFARFELKCEPGNSFMVAVKP